MNTRQSLIEQSPLAMATTEGPAHTVRSVNAAFCALQGKLAGEMIGLPVVEAITGAGVQSVLALLERVYGGDVSGFVNHLQYAEGGHGVRYMSYLVWGLPVLDGRAEGLVIQVTDFTERTPGSEHSDQTIADVLALNREILEVNEQLVISGLEQHALADEMREVNEQLVIRGLEQHALADMAARAELRLRHIVHGLSAIICEVDAANGKFTYVSEQAETFLGYPAQRWTEEGFWKRIIHAADYEQAMAGFRVDGLPEDVQQHVFRVVAADGSEIWLRNMMKAVRNTDGMVVKRRCIIVDVTKQQTDYLEVMKDLARHRAIAEALQYSILWEQPERSFHNLKVAAFYEPSMGDALVGGDLFDAFSLPNKSVMLIVGDVTGKGLTAATRISEIIFALRAFAQDYKDPADVMTRLNEFLCDFHGTNDGRADDLVVLSIVVVDPVSGAIRMAAAGAEPPFVLRASGLAEESQAGGLILGVDRDASYEVAELVLEKGDLLLMTTDGLTEARSRNDFFGHERILDVARAAGGSASLRDVGKAILDAARAYGGGRFGDDVCLLLTCRDYPTP